MFASFLVATPAHAETTMANEGQLAKYCAGVVQQVAPEISYSVVRQACSDESPAVAAALLDSAPALNSTDARNQQASADRIQIMTWYEGADFTGDSMTFTGRTGIVTGRATRCIVKLESSTSGVKL